MSVRTFSQDVRIVPIATYANANTDRTSEVIDTAGYDRCCIVVHFGDIAAGATETIRLQHSDVADDENTLNSGSNIAGTAQTVAADDDNEVKYVDIRPSKRYLQLVIDKDATNASAESAVAYLYGGNAAPVSHAAGGTDIGEGTDIAEGELHNTAVDGTA